MPELPSGQRVALNPSPLKELLENADHFGNIHKVMAINSPADVAPYVDIQILVPTGEPSSDLETVTFDAKSLPMPPGMVCKSSGYRLSDWEALARDWTDADKRSFQEFLDGRGADALGDYLDAVTLAQARLRTKDTFLARVLVGWWDAGCHPAQEDGWLESDIGTPDWDEYDVLAALGQVDALLLTHPECPDTVRWRVRAFWEICRRELPIDGWPAVDQPVRECAAVARRAGWLDAIKSRRRAWFRKQAIVECIQLWESFGDGFRAAMPQPFGIIELVVLANGASGHLSRLIAEIVSGGQTGADRAALDWAISAGLPHGGWCPAGREAEDGAISEKYQLIELPGAGYRQRTRKNVEDSDATLIFNLGELDGGSLATQRIAGQLDKPCHIVQLDSDEPHEARVRLALAWLREYQIRRLNIAGPRESKRPGIYAEVLSFLKRLDKTCESPTDSKEGG